MNWIPTGYKCKTYSPIVHEAGACFLVYSTVPREDFEDAHVLRWTASCLGFDSAGISGFWECALTHIVCCMEPDDGKAMQGTLPFGCKTHVAQQTAGFQAAATGLQVLSALQIGTASSTTGDAWPRSLPIGHTQLYLAP